MTANKIDFNIEQSDYPKTLWRYMDFTKFVDLLENSSIFFPKVSSFEDKFEGVHNVLEVNPGLYINKNEIPDFQREQYRHLSMIQPMLTRSLNRVRESFGISCWRLAEQESHAMWKIFLISNEGIAIKTTVGDLKNSIQLTNPQHVKFGKVKYIDFKTESIPMGETIDVLFYKNDYFAHESEFRVTVGNFDQNGSESVPFADIDGYGVSVSIDYKQLIKEIVVGPYAPSWFYSLVEKVASKYGIETHIIKSSIELR